MSGPRNAMSARRLLLLAMAGVALSVVALVVVVDVTFLPRIASLRSDTEQLMGQMQSFADHSAQLRFAVAVARQRLEAGDLDSARVTVERARAVTSTSLTAAVRTAMVDAPIEMRTALAAAIDHESQIRDYLSEAGALLELQRAADAEVALAHADSLTVEFSSALAGAQQSGLQDVARRGQALEKVSREVSRTLIWISALGILGVASIALLARQRLYLPLQRLDAGLRAVSAGDLDVTVDIFRNDEMGGLAALFNRMVRVMRQREVERESERQEMTRRILDATLDGVITLTPDGRIIGWNPGAEAIFGWSADDVVGKPLGDVIFPAAERAAHQERLRLIRSDDPAARQPRRIVITAVRRDGRRFPAEESIIPIVEGGHVVAVAGFVRDITKTLELQEQVRRSQRLEAVGRLAGGIAHDFNNLISVILGQTQLALEVVTDGDARRGLSEVERAANRAAELTAQLLAFARKQIVAPKVMAVNDLVTETLDMVGRVIEASVRITPHLDPEAGQVNVDPGHFSQVFLNLIMNARDALGSTGGKVEISTGVAHIPEGGPLQVPGGEYVRVAVTDDGLGIPWDIGDRIFEPFFSTKTGGTGLGLATCHGIVRQAGGAITATNVESGGAEFTVYLPRITSPSASTAPTN